jgi:leucyl-tRNA synthetase
MPTGRVRPGAAGRGPGDDGVQVNGKLRDTLTAPRGLGRDEAEALALSSEKVQRQLGGAEPRKVIVVPDRLVNIVA